MELSQEQIDSIIATTTDYGLRIIFALVIFFVGKWIANIVRKLCRRGMERANVDPVLVGFLANIVFYLLMVAVIIAAIGKLGIQTTSLVAVLGAAGLAIGLALQGTLSNVAAGVMLLLFRPFKVGDYIEGGGLAGTVKSITLFVTELVTPDNVQIIAPNSQLWGSAIKNYSFHATRRVDIVIGIAYEDDIDKARAAIVDECKKDSRVLADPEAMAAVTDLGDSSVNFTVRVWCNAADYWALKFELTKNLKNRMDAEEISIPYPQRTVHMAQAAAD